MNIVMYRNVRSIQAIFLLMAVFLLPAQSVADTGHMYTALDFSLFKMGSGAPVVLVVGGIQGDEPGGFSAATLLATRYTVKAGTVWVVPNLNFPSIVKRSRGIHGDMNRKFDRLDSADPEYPTVTRIQNLIRAPEVGLVLNLHDGSGYFRPKYVNSLCNASRWGQAVIIDQENLDEAAPLGQLGLTAEKVTKYVNRSLLSALHKYHVRNTRTAQGDREMEKSLSYYAVRHGKAAFGLEASKEFAVDMRAFYHLKLIEGFLHEAGVSFERDFKLSPAGVAAALQSDLSITFAGNRVLLPLEDVRPYIGFLPLPRSGSAAAIASKPIMAVVPDDGNLNVQYGNRTMTRIRPDWRDMDHGLDSMRMLVDGKEQVVFFGQVVPVRNVFSVFPVEGYRVNVIGVDSRKADESDLDLTLKHFQPRFSVDRSATLYRVEVYKNAAFAGMFLVRFGNKNQTVARDSLPGVAGAESTRGR